MTASHRPRFRLYMAISLDGFVASRDGSVRWLEPYDAYEAGFGEFLATVAIDRHGPQELRADARVRPLALSRTSTPWS